VTFSDTKVECENLVDNQSNMAANLLQEESGETNTVDQNNRNFTQSMAIDQSMEIGQTSSEKGQTSSETVSTNQEIDVTSKAEFHNNKIRVVTKTGVEYFSYNEEGQVSVSCQEVEVVTTNNMIDEAVIKINNHEPIVINDKEKSHPNASVYDFVDDVPSDEDMFTGLEPQTPNNNATSDNDVVETPVEKSLAEASPDIPTPPCHDTQYMPESAGKTKFPFFPLILLEKKDIRELFR
jgi:hypothetical protein